MDAFSPETLLLDTPLARRLYTRYAASLPIVDYHSHVDARDICEDRHFENLSALWLAHDHYKWRILRLAGVRESDITGDGPDWEKFLAFARALPQAAGSPVATWCHMELRHYFGYTGVLNEQTARQVWTRTARRLHRPDFGVQGLLARSGVRYLATTDDPADDLRYHLAWQQNPALDLILSPTFRPDRALDCTKPDWPRYLARLAGAAGCGTDTLAGTQQALLRRMDAFAAAGCRASDHALPRLAFAPCDARQAAALYRRALAGRTLTPRQAARLQTHLLLFCAAAYQQRGWAMQLHLGCLRNVNTVQAQALGPDTGFDCIGPSGCASLAALLDTLQRRRALPRMIVYSLDAGDNAYLDTLLSSFPQQEPGWLQHGSAWWFHDHAAGIAAQLESQAQQGLLGHFIGMLTDSRSFTSFVRHDYFRRVLCSLLGRWASAGLCPPDEAALGGIVRAVCYENACRFFRLPEAGTRNNLQGGAQ